MSEAALNPPPAEPAVAEICDFLLAPTPAAWLRQAADNIGLLLIDHANCEKKAASTALSLLRRYVDRPELLRALSTLAREELRHFEQVLDQMDERQVVYEHIRASRYAGRLRDCVSPQEPARLVDTLLVSAVVEARSCERFYRLQPYLPEPLASFYGRLLASEARHYQLYLDLADVYATAPFDAKLQQILTADAAAVTEVDTQLRFHSGPLAES